ncbi:GNAT family N-acetyltransferase [Herbaspirillum sp. NPDC087042]|uniref:GNAT family N-acetyltransferase n=1 Tax=Herbaspirillum sp. NPDC087042 TaxID=3364004 RepID=UPI003829A2CE
MHLFEPLSMTTRRLRLRPLREDDWQALFAIWSDAEAMRYFSFPAIDSVDQARDLVAGLLATSGEGSELVCVLELLATGEAIGKCDLFHAHIQCRRAEIGFSLQRRYWGNGYMNEAASALIGYAFHTLKLRRLEADIDPLNLTSAHLLERLGFIREGLLRERWVVSDEVSDSALYGLLHSDHRPLAISGPG